MTPALYDRLLTLGSHVDPRTIAATVEALAPFALKLTPEVAVERDVCYGPHARHRMDVFSSDSAASSPVLLYVHGGGFVAGDKGRPDQPFFNNVGAWAVEQGWIGITMTYRLAPESMWPAGSDDIELAIEFLLTNAVRLGIDPKRILLCGQSAGAAHVAGYVIRPDAAACLAGAVMLSGLYDLVDDETTPLEVAYYGSALEGRLLASTMRALASISVPCLYTVSELDPPKFQRQALGLVTTHMAVGGHWPRIVYLARHNHLSPMQLVGTEHDTVGPRLVEFASQAFEAASRRITRDTNKPHTETHHED